MALGPVVEFCQWVQSCHPYLAQHMTTPIFAVVGAAHLKSSYVDARKQLRPKFKMYSPDFTESGARLDHTSTTCSCIGRIGF